MLVYHSMSQIDALAFQNVDSQHKLQHIFEWHVPLEGDVYVSETTFKLCRSRGGQRTISRSTAMS